MKIAFICSSLEPGRDGVGDYTTRLAIELARKGHIILLIAINDKYISNVLEGVQQENVVSLTSLRLPNKMLLKQRFDLMNARLRAVNPDFISLQYSGFGFHRYGLPWYIVKYLRLLIPNYRIHIMYHELWCGMGYKADLKEKILGTLQLIFIKIMTLALKSEHTFTSTHPYVDSLKKIGIKSRPVPIFGTINLNEFGSEHEWELLTQKHNLLSLIENPEHWLVIGFFGTIYPCAGLGQLIQICSDASYRSKKKFCIITFGSNRGLNGDIVFKNILFDKYCNLDSLSIPMINRIIELVNFGVVTSTADGIDKSGTAKAWLERSVPVIISSHDRSYDNQKMKPMGVFQISEISNVLEALNPVNTEMHSNYLQKTVSAYEDLLTVHV